MGHRREGAFASASTQGSIMSRSARSYHGALLSGLAVLLALALFVPACPLSAQVARGWSPVTRLSQDSEFAQGPALVADRSGVLHAFWSSRPVDDPGAPFMLAHASMANGVWDNPEEVLSSPAAVYTGIPSAVIPHAVVDRQNVIHIFWTDNGLLGNLYYASSPAEAAHSARAWSRPETLQTDIYQHDVAIDTQGTIHLVYASLSNGVCHTSLGNGGGAWSAPACVPSCQVLRDDEYDTRPQLAVDGAESVYVVWVVSDYSPLSRLAYAGRAICFARSTDAGVSWSVPTTLDVAESRSQTPVRAPEYPAIIVDQAGAVHVVWVGAPDMQRYHTYSQDGGRTWAERTVALPVGGYNNWMGLVASNDGLVHLVSPNLYGASSVAWDGAAWGARYDFPQTEGAHYADALAGTDGVVHAVWQDHGGGRATEGHILYARLGSQTSTINGESLATVTPQPVRPTEVPVQENLPSDVLTSLPAATRVLGEASEPIGGWSPLLIGGGAALVPLAMALIVWMKDRR